MGLFSSLGVDIPGILNDALGSALLPATLTSYTRGARTAGHLTEGTTDTGVDHACRGVVSDYNDHDIDGTLVMTGDRRVLIIARSLSGGAVVPKATDKIAIEGRMYNVIRVTRDPAGATYELQAR